MNKLDFKSLSIEIQEAIKDFIPLFIEDEFDEGEEWDNDIDLEVIDYYSKSSQYPYVDSFNFIFKHRGKTWMIEHDRSFLWDEDIEEAEFSTSELNNIVEVEQQEIKKLEWVIKA